MTGQPHFRNAAHHRGVTLIELVVVIGLIGIISVVAAIAIRDPILSYRDTNRRAELTDIADVALRRMARDIRLALPNSLRTSGADPVYLEMLLTRTGGRYREENDTDGGTTVHWLHFHASDTVFDSLGTLGDLATQQPVANRDFVAIHNLFATGSLQANAYTFGQPQCNAPTSVNCNTSLITGVADVVIGSSTVGKRLTIDARKFPLSSPGNRFYVVQGAVSYACDPGAPDANGDGTGTLTRIYGYDVALNQPDDPSEFTNTETSGILARYVTACDIDYAPLLLHALGLVSIHLELTRGHETVRLYHEVHVNNVP